jgi:hypothetical protein
VGNVPIFVKSLVIERHPMLSDQRFAVVLPRAAFNDPDAQQVHQQCC